MAKPTAPQNQPLSVSLGPLPPLSKDPGNTSASVAPAMPAQSVHKAEPPAKMQEVPALVRPVVAAVGGSLEKSLAQQTVNGATTQATPKASAPGTTEITVGAKEEKPAPAPSPFADVQKVGNANTQPSANGQGSNVPAADEQTSLKVTGKDFAAAVKQAGKDYVEGGKSAGQTLKTMATLPFMKEPVSLTLDQIVSALFFLGLGFQVLLMWLFRPSLVWFIVFGVVGTALGLGLSFIYYKNKRDKAVKNQVLSLNLGQKGVQHLLGFLPTWFQVSEREKMEWLNEIIEEMWPYVDKAASNMIKEITQRETSKVLKENKALGAAVKEIGFKHLTFGGAPFRVEGIMVEKNTPDSLVMEVDVRYAGDPNITLAITVPTGKVCPRVTDIVFVGSMRITLAPLTDRIPGFVAAVATFLKPPLIKYRLDFGRLGGSLAAAPIGGVVNYFVKDTITKMLVWPQRLVIPIIQQTQEDRLVAQRLQLRSQGVIRVKVVKAKDLPNKDTFGKNDAFAELTTDNEKVVTTSTKRGAGAEPVWNEEFFLLVQEPDSQEMRVSVRDRDMINPAKVLSGQFTKLVNSSQLIGRTLVKLRQFTKEDGMTLDSWEPLGSGDWGNPGGPGKDCGKILLRCTYRSFASFTKAEVDLPESKGIVLVRLVQVKSVARSPDQMAINVSTVVKLDKSGKKDLPNRYWSMAAEKNKIEWATKPIASTLFSFAESKKMLEEPELVSWALSKCKDLKQDIANLNVTIFRKLVDMKEVFGVPGGGKTERASPWRDRLADLVDTDTTGQMRALFKEYEKNRLRVEKGWFDVDLDYSADKNATAVFYDVSNTDEVVIKIMEKALTSADEKLGRLSIGVSEIQSSHDVNMFTGEREWGYMHKELVEMDESEDQNGKKAQIEVICRWVPYFKSDDPADK